MKNILITAYSFVAAIIGAGFASGQEILCYFSVFGRNGFCGIILSCVFFITFTFAVYSFCIKNNINNYSEFLINIPYPFIKKTIYVLTGVFSFAVYSVMLAATGEILYQHFGISQALGALLCVLICSFLFCKGIDKVFSLNGIIGIFMTTVIIVCCLYILRYREYHVFSNNTRLITSSLTYAGYNLITTTPVLVTLSKKFTSRKDALLSSVISGFTLLSIMTLIFCILAVYVNKINLGEFPMLTMALRQNRLLGLVYGILLIMAIITTMLASGGSLCETFSLSEKPFLIWIIGFCAYFLSSFGFSKLINSAYRICGIVGFMLTFGIIYICFKKI